MPNVGETWFLQAKTIISMAITDATHPKKARHEQPPDDTT